MAGRRANGQGSVYRDRARNRWAASIVVGRKDDGTPIRRVVTARTQAEVLNKLDRLQRVAEVDATLPVEMTVAQFLNYWERDVLPLADITDGTRENYAAVVRSYVTPHIGAIRLDLLAPADVRRMLTKLRDRGLAAGTQRLARSILRRALRTAETDGLVAKNVAALVDGVRLDQDEGRSLTPDQAKALLDAVAGTDDEALITVLLSLGLRRGEALGLSWSDVKLDAERPTLRVVRSLRRPSNGLVKMGAPKTKRSRRTIKLPASVVPVLRRHRAAQARQRLAFGPGWGGDWAQHELVFTTSTGEPVAPHALTNRVKALTIGLGFGAWTPHELRHTAASLMLAAGVPLKTVSETLGHSSIKVTADVYGHLMEPQRDEAAEAMERMLWG